MPTIDQPINYFLNHLPSDVSIAVARHDHLGRVLIRRMDEPMIDWAHCPDYNPHKAAILALREARAHAFIDLKAACGPRFNLIEAEISVDPLALARAVSAADIAQYAPMGGPRLPRVRRDLALITRQIPANVPTSLNVRDETGAWYHRSLHFGNPTLWVRMAMPPQLHPPHLDHLDANTAHLVVGFRRVDMSPAIDLVQILAFVPTGLIEAGPGPRPRDPADMADDIGNLR